MLARLAALWGLVKETKSHILVRLLRAPPLPALAGAAVVAAGAAAGAAATRGSSHKTQMDQPRGLDLEQGQSSQSRGHLSTLLPHSPLASAGSSSGAHFLVSEAFL